jgi:hypothetical protein
MTRWIPLFALVLLAACSTTQPVAEPVAVNPVTDPTIAGAIDEAAVQGSINAEAVAPSARRAGRIAGVIAAVVGGPERESVDSIVDRYRMTRDVVEGTTLAIAASKGATAGAKRGFQLDLQFAELYQLPDVDVFRPSPDQIDVHIERVPSQQTLSRIAAVFVGREERDIEIQASGSAALDLRDSLISLGVPATSLTAHRNDDLPAAVIRIRYRN